MKGDRKDPRSHSAASPLVATRLEPQYHRKYLKRGHLLLKAQEVLRCRLTIVHAGAGYGKTSLLSQWLNAFGEDCIPTAWLTLEDDEATPTAFMTSVITACVRAGYLSDTILNTIGHIDEKMSAKALMAIFINAVTDGSGEPLVIFLDEYNRVQSDAMDSFLQVVIRNVPEHVHFVVASRWRPSLGLENLRIHEDLLEITAADLRFTAEDASTLLGAVSSDMDARQIGDFINYTAGWPMALQMLRLWLSGGEGRMDLIGGFVERTVNIANYLTEQVLSELPEDERSFLIQTSILDRLNGDVANAVTGRSDGWLMLEQLHERNLFLEPQEGERSWFRFHAVFLEYLRDQLKKHHADTLADMHERAARWFESRGHIRRALSHAQVAGLPSLVARFLPNAGGWRMVMDGRIDVLRAYLDKMSEPDIAAYPKLQLARIFLLVKVGHIDEARHMFEALDTRDKTLWSDGDLIDHQIIDNTISDYADERVSFEEISEIVALRAQVPRQDHLLQALLADSLATKLCAMRQFQQALAVCTQAISHYRVLRSFYGEMFIRFKQVQAYLAQGKLDEAEAILKQNEQEIEIRLGRDSELAAHNAIFMAELMVERHSLEAAEAYLDTALPRIEQEDGWFELYAIAYSTAAVLAWQKSGIDEVMRLLERARAVAQSRLLKRLDYVADCEAVFYLCLNGQSRDAAPYADRLKAVLRVEAEHAHFLSSHIAVCLGLYYLSLGRYDDVDALMTEHLETSETAGDIRQSIAICTVAAAASHSRGRTEEAAALFDQAIQHGLFKGFRQAYINYTFWLLPLVNLLIKNESLLPPDRYRANFLTELRRDMKAWEKVRLQDEYALTIGEQEVLRALDQGSSNKEIAIELGISPNTVKFRLSSIFTKVGVSKRTDLVRLAREQGLLNSADCAGRAVFPPRPPASFP
jgi:LuxR family maltose regulon positive regulatory protein